MGKLYKLTLLFIVILLGHNAMAYDFSVVCSTGQTLYYNITSSTEPYTVEVTSENTSSPYYTTYPTGVLEIPGTVEYNSVTYSVASIVGFAFYNCSGLTEITIPAPITSIGEQAFAYCTGLIVVNFNAENCTLMENTNNYVFDDSALVTVNIGDNVRNIPDYAFDWCYYLETITIGRSVESIGDYAFGNCRRLATVNYNAINCTSISSNAFRSSYFTTLNIDDEVINIPANAFYQCYGIFSITIPNSVESIGNLAFYCVKNIIYNGSATGSPWGALTFDGYIEGDLVYEDDTKVNLTGCDKSATSVEIPNSVTSIGHYAFSQCSGLTSITIPENVTSIGDLAFTGCTGLTEPIYNGTCFAYLPKEYTGEYAIPEGIQKIAGYACLVCNSLTEITIPSSVVSIGFLAFSSCNVLTTVNYNATNATLEDSTSPFSGSELTTVNIGENVKHIPDYAFEGCDEIIEITIPDSVTSIGEYAFYSCEGLTSVTLGNSIDTIGNRAFYNSDNITDIYSLSITPPFLGQNLVSNALYQTVNVWIPCATIDSYRSDNQWNRFANIRSEQTTHYNIVVETDDANMGDVTGAGSFTCDTEVELVATPNEGYRFVSWNDGNEDNPRTIVVAGDSTFTASFRAIKTITATAGEGGTINPSGNVTVDEGSDQEFTIRPNECYAISSVIVDDIDVTDELVDSIYTFTNVTTDHTIDVSFVMLTYTITATAGENGTITPSGEYVINCGDEQSYTIIPDNGYLIASVLVDDIDVTDDLVDGVYTFTNVTANHTIEATFEEIPTYTITVLANNDAYGMVSGGGTYEEGTEVVIMAMPNSDYCFLSWDDGDTFNPRTITVTSDSTFVANFSATTHFAIDTTVTKYLTIADRTFYVAGQYSFVVPAEIGCDTIIDLNLRILDEPETYDISPNPAKSIISISSENYISFVEFYSTAGRLVMRKEINAYQAEISVEELIQGVYFIRLYGEDESLPTVQRFVKE